MSTMKLRNESKTKAIGKPFQQRRTRQVNRRLCNLSKVKKNDSHLLNRIAKLATGEFIPQAFNSGKISGGDSLHFGKVDKVSSFGFGSGENNECIAGKLLTRCRRIIIVVVVSSR